MKLFILGLGILLVVVFYTYQEKIRENYINEEATVKAEMEFIDEEQDIADMLQKFPIGSALVPSGNESTTSFLSIPDQPEFLKTKVADFVEEKAVLAPPHHPLDDKVLGCKTISKCDQLSNGDCGYCAFTGEFRYGGKNGPAADVCPSNAWTNDPKTCEELREKLICKQVKTCAGLVGEAANVCGWCPTSGRAMPAKQVGNKKVPKYADDICDNKGYGLLDAAQCAKFFRDHPCLTPTAYSGPHSAQCLSSLWKKGGCTRKVDWMTYAKNKNNYYQKKGMDTIVKDVKAWLNYTKSADYATAKKGELNCFGTSPDPCNNQFKPTPVECLDKLWEKGGGQKSGTGLPSKSGYYSSGQDPYVTTISGQHTAAQAQEACAKKGYRVCDSSEASSQKSDPENDYSYSCTTGSTFATYNDSTLTPAQKALVDSRWPGKAPSYYACVQGCEGDCIKDGQGPLSNAGTHCCKIWDTSDTKTSIVNKTKDYATDAISGSRSEQAGYMQMVFGKNWTPPPAPKKGDTVKISFSDGGNTVYSGIVVDKMGNKNAIMWTSREGTSPINRYTLKNDTNGMATQRQWFGWPGIRATTNLGNNVDSIGLVLDKHLTVTNACSLIPTACGNNCETIVRQIIERFPLPQDCVVSSWGNWTPCSKPCGGGTQERRRGVRYPAKFGGNTCPPLRESRTCNTQVCMLPNFYKNRYSKSVCQKDPANQKWYRCTTGSTYATYNASTLCPAQKAQAFKLWGDKARNPAYYACAQGCAGTCRAAGNGVLANV